MGDGIDPELRKALLGLQQSLARIAGELGDVAGRVGEVLQGGDGSVGDARNGPAGVGAADGEVDQDAADRVAVDRGASDQDVIAAELAAADLPTPPFGIPAAVPHSGGAPVGGFAGPIVAPLGYPSPQGLSAYPLAPGYPSPQGLSSYPPAPGYPPAYPPPLRPASQAGPQRQPGYWADNTGLKILGWVGGGVTVLGIVLLLVVAAQQGMLSPLARVIIGLVLGVALVAGGALLHRQAERASLALTLACTGLAALYLTVIGAVQLAALVPPVVGFVGCAVIVVAAVLLAVSWREPWLAGASFLVSGLLAPAVGDGLTDPVLVFEAIMVAGAAGCLLLGVGLHSFTGAALAAGIVCLVGVTTQQQTPARLLVVAVIVTVTWATMLARRMTGRMQPDPGPFPLRVPSPDPAQVARDYADFHAHQRIRALARADVMVWAVSLAVSAGLLVLAVAALDVTDGGNAAATADGRSVLAATLSAALAVVFGALAWVGRREPLLHATSMMVTAWSAALAFAGVAALRAVGTDARGLAWVIIAAIALAVAAADRTTRLLWPALAAGFVALLSTMTVVGPTDLMTWPYTRLVAASGLSPRALTQILPAGLALIVMAAIAWWAVHRCTAHLAGRTTLLVWSLIGCVAIAVYGATAVTMVLAYAISPTEGGYQGGQVAVTVLLTLVGMALLWQGFRQVVLRIGGLCLAGLAVAKLLLVDTQSLSAMPRAITFLGVGVLLLISAVAYLRTMSRLAARRSAGE